VHPDFIGGVYWRKSVWNARACVPAILNLRSDGQLSLWSMTETAFTSMVSEVQIDRGNLGTLTIRANGSKYAIVGRGGAISENSAPQLGVQLQDAVTAGAVLVGGNPGVVDSPYNYGAMLDRTAEWAKTFRSVAHTHFLIEPGLAGRSTPSRESAARPFATAMLGIFAHADFDQLLAAKLAALNA
jgi:hypothetical protein